MPTISVVIPTYNRASLVSDAIESALRQTVAPTEVIVVDDGSQDETQDVVQRFGRRVRYVLQPNAGVAAARNTGTSHASGEWVAFLDSDDIWEQDKLDLQLAALRNWPDIGWSLTDFTVVDGQGKLRGDEPWSPRVFGCLLDMRTTARELFGKYLARHQMEWIGGDIDVFLGDLFPLLFYGNVGLPSTMMVRRDVFQRSGGFDPSFRVAEDTEFLHRLSAYSSVAIVCAPLVRYRVAHGLALTNTDDPRPAVRNALQSILQASRLRTPLGRVAEEARREGEARLRLRLARGALSACAPEEARAALSPLSEGQWSLERVSLTGLGLLPAFVLRGALRIRRFFR